MFQAVRAQWRAMPQSGAPVIPNVPAQRRLSDEDIWDCLEDPPEEMKPPVPLGQLLKVLVEKWDEDGLYD